tara:strand:- start:13241 stop:14395 length:1155 start_codon:yes stop_codon:yes gene_type:complete
MNIGIVTGEYPPMKGGVGDYTRNLALHLTTAGHKVQVITDQRCVSPSNNDEHKIIANISKRWSWLDLWRIRSTTSELDVVCIQYQAAAYGSMSPPIHFLPCLTIPPTIITFHDFEQPYLFPKAGNLRKHAIWQMARCSDGIITTNSEDYRICTKALSTPRVVEIPIGSNIPYHSMDRLSNIDIRAQYGIGEDELIIGYFGLMNKSKGGKTLIQTLASLHSNDIPARLLLIGELTGSTDATNAKYYSEVNKLAHDLGVAKHIVKTGYLNPLNTSAALLCCDLMVLPFIDGASFRHGSLLACLTHGCPTITTNPKSENKRLQNETNIMLVPPNHPTSIVKTIKKLHENAMLRTNIGQAAMSLSRDFEWQNIADQTTDFIDEVLMKH